MADQLLNRQGQVKYKGKWIKIEDLPKGAKPDMDQANVYGSNLFTTGTAINDFSKLATLQPNHPSLSTLSMPKMDTSRFDQYGFYGPGGQGNKFDFYKNEYEKQQANKGGLFGKGWVTDENLTMFASGAKGIGSIVDAYTALKTLGLNKEMIADNRQLTRANYNAQLGVLNREIAEDNAFKQAQGMYNSVQDPLANAYS